MSGTTTTTVYVGALEEVATTGSSTTVTTYYYVGSLRIAEAVNGVFTYLADDGLGSATLAQGAGGTTQAALLYAPYGTTRYSSGTMPTDYEFTGQHSDSATGLDYYNARYYDPTAGQFASADPAGDGLNLYIYVKGNPETLTDPTGLFTVSVCAGGSGGLGIGAFFQGCIAIGRSSDGQWSAGLTRTAGAGGYGGIGIGPNAGIQFSSANTVDDLRGPFGFLDGSGQLGLVGVGVGGFLGTDSKNRGVFGGQFGWAGGFGAGILGGLSDTQVLDFKDVPALVTSTLFDLTQHVSDARQQASDVTSAVTRKVNSARRWADQEAHDAGQWAQQQTEKAKAFVNQAQQQFTSWLQNTFGWP